MKRNIPLILAFIISSIVLTIGFMDEFSILSAGILLSLLVIALECQVIFICLSTYEENGKGRTLFVSIGVTILMSLAVILVPFVHIAHCI